MHFQICTGNLKTFVYIWNEMKNGCFFPTSTNCAWEMARPVFCRGWKVLLAALSQCSQPCCAVIKRLTFAGTGMQRNIWNTEISSHPEAAILSLQLASGRALCRRFPAGCHQPHVSPVPLLLLTFGWWLVKREWPCFRTELLMAVVMFLDVFLCFDKQLGFDSWCKMYFHFFLLNWKLLLFRLSVV